MLWNIKIYCQGLRDFDKRKSTIGYVFTLRGGAVSCVSKLQTIVALYTTEA